ncbi:MAG: flagellar hook-basal body complex protein [Pseudomonadota bacterium]
MGIFGALSTAVSGLRAQSYAIENISGNIANSQTAGFKRVDTFFSDLVPDTGAARPLAGSTLAFGRSSLQLQGDLQASGIKTNMAINGSGMFIIDQQVSSSDGRPLFSGVDIYTRRGDFQLDRYGYLVNGAGYYLKGLPIDPTTGNPTGSVPQVIQVATDFQAASPTTQIDYRANLAKLPLTANYQAGVPGSELLQPGSYPPGGNPRTTGTVATAATITAANTYTNIDLSDDAGDQLSFDIDLGGTTKTITLDRTGVGAGAGGDNIYTIAEAVAEIQAQLNAGPALGVTVGSSGGKLTFTASTPGATALTVDNVAIVDGGTAGGNLQAATDLGVTVSGGQNNTGSNAGNGIVYATDASDFVSQSVEGGGISVFDSLGSTVNVQFRWAKIDSTPGAEKWNLFYLENSAATGSEVAWRNVGVDYNFDATGRLSPAVLNVTLSNMTINGSNIGDITLQHGDNGLTQFQDPNGTAQLTTLDQNGYPAGQLASIAVEDGGALIGTYSNGRSQKLAQVVLADFKGLDFLQRLDGGAYAVTQSSGAPILGATGSVVGASVEASNTDIADEFTKLIVTQQAYTANTRIVSTSNDMLQEALNMIR